MGIKKIYYVDKELVLGTIMFQEKTVTNFCKELGCSRVNFYAALNRAYTKPRSPFMTKVIKKLGLQDNLVWSEEEYVSKER